MQKSRYLVLFYFFLLAAPGLLSAKSYMRQKAYNLNALWQVNVLRHTNTGNVHLGREGWLFYFNKSDGTALEDFWGVSSPSTLQESAQRIRQFVKAPYGFKARYLFVIAPNKETLYPEFTNYLFADYRFSENKYLERIPAATKDLDAHVLSLYGPLLHAKGKHQLYNATDTHWNDWGAYVAHLAILKSVNNLLGTQTVPLPSREDVLTVPNPHDIFLMLNGLEKIIGFNEVPQPHRKVNLPGACCQTAIISDGNYVVYENPSAQKVIWVVGDSFSDKLQFFLAPYYRKIVFMRFFEAQKYLPRAFKDSGPPDLIIDQRAERYLTRQ